ncbi:ComF family protein [Tuanshanicoccus lijuaniae]|uniref:ComF family protein n=1 Tax=Aerococcaceae bacterium zg-1292 TaxID=2774330 RepID=UPI0019369DF7|nr:ComF family protein [Aerococcaceae bacterium zg-1292]QQA37178.1 ComF family protein [Aerococcaceae bacterium zg-1292]
MFEPTMKWHDLWCLQRLYPEVICEKCQQQFSRCEVSQQLVCQYCQHPIEQGNVCTDCQHWLTIYDESFLQQVAIYYYNEAFQAWIVDYKYHGDTRQAAVMLAVLNEYYRRYQAYQWIILPSSPKSLKQRGFIPAEYLLQQAKIPYDAPLVYAGDGKKQAKKTKIERLALTQPFALKSAAKLRDKVLIFDDVYTTGTTLIRAKEVLYHHGVKVCVSLTLARDLLE